MYNYKKYMNINQYLPCHATRIELRARGNEQAAKLSYQWDYQEMEWPHLISLALQEQESRHHLIMHLLAPDLEPPL
jgi:hypothetical protein